jgi:restriction system protein
MMAATFIERPKGNVMPEITRKRHGEFIQNVLRILVKERDGLPAHAVLERLTHAMPPTPFESSDYPKHPGIRRFEKMARFATIMPVKAGWMTKAKGIWSITDEGKKVLTQFSDPEELAREVHNLYRQWKKNQPETPEDEEAESVAVSTLEEAEEEAWATIADYLRDMNPYDFQNLVAALLEAMGYHVDWVSPPGRDEGLDIVAYADPLGVKGPRIKVQVKRRGEKISFEQLGSFLSRLGDQDVGIYVSTGGFTTDAEMKARAQEKRQVMLLDLPKLFDLWVEHYARIGEIGKRLLPLKPIYYLAKEP